MESYTLAQSMRSTSNQSPLMPPLLREVNPLPPFKRRRHLAMILLGLVGKKTLKEETEMESKFYLGSSLLKRFK